MPVEIKLNEIRTDGGTQMRAELRQEVYFDYRDQWLAGVEFDPVDLFHDGSAYWIADGFHRFYGAREAKRKTIAAHVHQGTQRDAILFAAGANDKHGLRRSNADKRKAVETLLNDEEWCKWSDQKVAEAAAVSQPFVSEVRKQLITVISSPAARTAGQPRIGRDGKARKPPVKNDPADPQSKSGAVSSYFDSKPNGKGKEVVAGLSEPVASLVKSGKLKATQEQQQALAEYTEESQEELAESVVSGRQTLEQAIERGEVPEPTVEETIKAKNSAIEKFARKLSQTFCDECPEDEWLDDLGRRETAFKKLQECCATLRTAKCHAECPACEGAGCKHCHKTGRVPKGTYDQLV